jgi:hypothetical protein
VKLTVVEHEAAAAVKETPDGDCLDCIGKRP